MPNQPNRPKRILIVDDEPTIVFFLTQGLQESNISCQVDSAATGEEALTKFTYNSYDLLITDLKMPGISGFTLVEVARFLHPDLGVIVMTAYGSQEVKDQVAMLEVDGYLTKPFSTAKLQEIAVEILAAKIQNQQSVLTEKNLSSI